MASIVISGDTSGAVTLSAPAISGATTLTLPTTSGTLVVTGGAQTVQFAAGSAAAPSITFTGDTNTGIFSPAADTIAFSEGGVESMRIDSSGNLLVGKTIIGDTTEGNIIAPTYVFFTRNGFAPLNLRRLTSSGSIAEFYSGTSGTSAGAISVASTGMTYTGTNGITFTATQTASADANTLDDYEEGTYTVTLTAGISGTITLNSGINTLKYTKVGRLVTIQGRFAISSISSPTGQVRMSLPFVNASGGAGQSDYASFSVFTHDVDLVAGTIMTFAESNGGDTTTAIFQTLDNAAWVALSAATLKGNGNEYFYVVGSYFTT